MRKCELIKNAMEILERNDEIFDQCVEEVDSYNGYFSDWRCYPMYELDEFFQGVKPIELLEKFNFKNFNVNDEYFYETIFGICSTDYPHDVYTSNISVGELLDDILLEYCHLNIYSIDKDLDEILERIYNEDYDEE